MITTQEKNILLVDDDVIILDEHRLSLEEYGYNVITAHNSESAISEVESGTEIDLVLMDIELDEERDGTETAQLILDRINCPVLFLSVHTDPETVKKTEKVSSYGYIVKGTGMSVLDTSIKTALKLHQSLHGGMEQELRKNRDFTEALLNASPDIIYIYNIIEKRNIYSNRRIRKILGYGAAEIREMNTGMIPFLLHPDDYSRYQQEILPRYGTMADNDIIQHEYRARHKDGRWIWLKSRESIFSRAPDGSPVQIFGVVTDISETRRQHDEISTLLQEKELLLKEVHHRMKNNMNIIISLLSIQADSLEVPEAVPAFNDAINRVKSMQILYDKLYQDEDYRETSVQLYIEQLISEVSTMLTHNIDLDIDLSIDDFMLDTKTVFSIGIAINELLTNSIKHAFRDREKGYIDISIDRKEKHVEVVFKDDGVGIPEEDELKKSSQFGLNLVRLLTEQHAGTLNIERNGGTRFSLTFAV